MRGIIVALLAPLLAWQAGNDAIVGVTRTKSPEFALRFNDNDAVALAAYADQVMLKTPDNPDFAYVTRLARNALSSQGLNPSALRLLGYAADVRQDQGAARKLIVLSTAASRREVGAQFWLIEDSVNREDLKGALKHYDAILRVSSESSAVLFPLLSNALSDAPIRAELAPYIKRNSPWLLGFSDYAISNGTDLPNFAAAIAVAGGLPKNAAFRALEQALLRQLVSKGHVSEAKIYFKTVAGVDYNLISSINFTDANVAARNPAMVWQAVGSASAGASFGQTSKKSNMRIFAGSGDRMVVAKKLLFLTSGTYQFEAQFGGVQAPQGSGMSLNLHCLGNGASLPTWTSGPFTPRSGSTYKLSFDVPANCVAQSLEVEMIGGQEQSDAEFELTALTSTPRPNGS